MVGGTRGEATRRGGKRQDAGGSGGGQRPLARSETRARRLGGRGGSALWWPVRFHAREGGRGGRCTILSPCPIVGRQVWVEEGG